jgi:hypothetical protein
MPIPLGYIKGYIRVGRPIEYHRTAAESRSPTNSIRFTRPKRRRGAGRYRSN